MLSQIILEKHGDPIAVHVRASRRSKHIAIKLSHKGVELVLPIFANVKSGHEFLLSKELWVREKLKKACYSIDLNENKIPIFGKFYDMVQHISSSPEILITDKEIIILAEENQHKNLLKTHLKKKLLHKVFDIAQQVSTDHNLQYNEIKLTKSICKWGSCSVKKNLTFNWRLCFAPQEILEYVVAHELSHLKEMNHGKDFWSLVAKIYPDYKKARLWLKNNGSSLHRFLTTFYSCVVLAYSHSGSFFC